MAEERPSGVGQALGSAGIGACESGDLAAEPPVRIELTTFRLQGECSTTELRRPWVNRVNRVQA
jgi:hypothetical protein